LTKKDAPFPAQAMADFIVGNWTVSRTMIDFLARATYSFSGDAVVTADAFTEHGLMRIGDQDMPASRRYRLDVLEHSTRILHADGRDFIELVPKAAQTVHHHCGADIYAGRFFFRGPDEWVETWRVKGPRKNYASLGRFRRLYDPSSGSHLLEGHVDEVRALENALIAGEESGAPVAFDSNAFLSKMRAKHAR
jgi:Arc/MetJ-type ribon-helix-helix transcriptional regulator